jgi:HK97 family phage portal protein
MWPPIDAWTPYSPSAVPHLPGNPNGAQALSAVLGCVNFIAGNLGSLPAVIYTVNGGRRMENASHPVNRVLQQPAPGMTWPETVEFLIADVLLYGNALAVLDHDLSGRLVGLKVVPWRYVTSVSLLPSDRLVYEVTWYGRPTVRYLASEVIHFRDRGDHTFIGRSRISRAAAAMQQAASADVAALAMFEQSVRPSGAFKINGRRAQENQERLAQHVRETVAGATKAGKVLVLEEGLDFVPFSHSITGHDAEILASRQWAVVDIARIFGVPPQLIGDWSNSRGAIGTEAMTLFATTTLRHWVMKFEASFNAAVFGASTGARYELALDMSGLQRADPTTRVAADNILLSHGVISKNECRESWGYSPSDLPEMDQFMQSPQTGGPQTTGTQPGGMVGAPT